MASSTIRKQQEIVEQLVTGGTDSTGDMGLGLNINEYVVLNVLSLRSESGYYTSFFTPVPTGTMSGKWAAKMLDMHGSPIPNTRFAVMVYYIRK